MSYNILTSGNDDELVKSKGPFRIDISDNSFFGSQESETFDIGTLQVIGESGIISFE